MDYIKWIRSKVGKDMIFLPGSNALIKDSEGRILLQHRKDTETWGLLGGYSEIGESFEDTLIREVQEESGLIVKATRVIGIYSNYPFEFPNGDKVQSVSSLFECEIISGTIAKNEESIELEWFNIENIPDLVSDLHESMVQDYKANLNHTVWR